MWVRAIWSLTGAVLMLFRQCFGTYDAAKYKQDGREQKWRLWLFQVCTQWGYFMPAPPEGQPRIVSKLCVSRPVCA